MGFAKIFSAVVAVSSWEGTNAETAKRSALRVVAVDLTTCSIELLRSLGA